MESNELQTLYELACANVSRNPDASQFAVWESVLLRFSRTDLRQALGEWWADTEPIDWYGTVRSRGALMPTPADLLPVLFRLKKERIAANKFKPCHKDGCAFDGWKRVQADDGEFDFKPCECRLAWEAKHGRLTG